MVASEGLGCLHLPVSISKLVNIYVAPAHERLPGVLRRPPSYQTIAELDEHGRVPQKQGSGRVRGVDRKVSGCVSYCNKGRKKFYVT